MNSKSDWPDLPQVSKAGVIPARPTVYKGIQMRSRLEADYAASLDREGDPWEYEPTCFASEDGQWLPDFRVGENGIYIELKSAHLLEPNEGESWRDVVYRVDAILKRMSVAWATDPRVWLELIFWVHGHTRPALLLMGKSDIPWFTPLDSGLPLLWPGTGQWNAVRDFTGTAP